MTFSVFVAAIVALVSLLAVCTVLHRAKKPVRRVLAGAGCGVAALGAVNLLAFYTGVSIALNYATAFVAVVLGVPGVIALLVLRVILGS